MTGNSAMATGSRIIVFHLTSGGEKIAKELQGVYPEIEAMRYKKGIIGPLWSRVGACVFIMASGIVLRAVAPFIKDKRRDPAVIVIDEKGKHVISLLGGHEAGANRLAGEIAACIGGRPVITTATDINHLTPIDVFARENELAVERRELLPTISARHLEEGTLRVYSEIDVALPGDYRGVPDPEDADVLITYRQYPYKGLYLRPGRLVLGIGLNTGTGTEEIERAVLKVFEEHGLSPLSLSMVATHEKKKTEKGLREFALKYGLEIKGFSAEEINSVPDVEKSEAARKALGVNGVAEPSALLASRAENLIVKKRKTGNLTLAVSESEVKKLFVVGTGPGGLEHMTPKALHAVRNAEVIVGYKKYLELITPLIKGKEVSSSVMTEEIKRVKAAVESARKGKKVCLISGGDPGVYAMAGPVFEVVKNTNAPVEVEVIPGISALNACAARLGAPLMHDFSAVSLSDRLTPWSLIEERLEAAAGADFVIVLYNPKSRGRTAQIEKARNIILKHRKPDTPVGIVKAAMRGDEDVIVTTLGNMLEHDIDMQSTVVIGNSMSFRWRGRIITPRGYERKYAI